MPVWSREGRVIEQCHKWLTAASKAGSVHEDEAFACFADAFAQIEMHLQRSLIDPLDDTSHMIAFAEQRAAELDKWIVELSGDGDISVTVTAGSDQVSPAPVIAHVKDADIPPQFREVFIEESEEIVAELAELSAIWCDDPQLNAVLRDVSSPFSHF